MEPDLGEEAGKNGPGYMLAHPNIHLIYDLLEHGRVEVWGSVLCIQGYRISTTQGSHRMSRDSPSEGPAWMAQQRPGASNQTSDSL